MRWKSLGLKTSLHAYETFTPYLLGTHILLKCREVYIRHLWRFYEHGLANVDDHGTREVYIVNRNIDYGWILLTCKRKR